MIYRAPNRIPYLFNPQSVFLAGTIDMGNGENWQPRYEQLFDSKGWDVFNPRRLDWDSTWVQSKDNPEFYQQVDWELNSIDKAALVLFYFAPESNSKVTMAELGLTLGTRTPNTILVYCPESFDRKGNVDILCERYGVQVFGNENELLKTLWKL